MNSLLTAALIGLYILAAGFYAGLEIGGYLLNRIRLRFRVRQADHSAQRLQRVLKDAHLFIFTVLIGHNIAVYLVSRTVTELYMGAGFSAHAEPLLGFIPWNAETAATLTLMLPLFLCAEIIPKNLFRRHADRLMYRSSSLLLFSWYVLQPVTRPLKLLFRRLTGAHADGEGLSGFSLSLQGLREYFTEDVQRGSLSDHQHGMINNLVSMERVSVRDVMSPVASVPTISETATVEEALNLLRERDAEQLAVYRGSVRRLTGFITLFDLIDPSLTPESPVKPLLRKPARLSVDLSLSRAFRRLRHSSEMLAVITDRSSRSVGVLHLSDIARYIVSAG